MKISELRRTSELGNKVVLFDKVRDPLRPGSRILYEPYAVFAKFEDLQASWKYQQKLDLCYACSIVGGEPRSCG